MHDLMFALVISLCPAHGECKDGVVDVYDTKQECIIDRNNRHINGECYEVTGIIHQQ